MNKKYFEEINLISLILLIAGIIIFFLEFSCSYLFNYFSEIINKQYKEKYYSLVFNQDIFLYKESDLNQISKGIKRDLNIMETGVFY